MLDGGTSPAKMVRVRLVTLNPCCIRWNGKECSEVERITFIWRFCLDKRTSMSSTAFVVGESPPRLLLASSIITVTNLGDLVVNSSRRRSKDGGVFSAEKRWEINWPPIPAPGTANSTAIGNKDLIPSKKFWYWSWCCPRNCRRAAVTPVRTKQHGMGDNHG
jgi:hypothetical protein